MRRQHPNPRMSIPISLEVWQRLTGASFDTDYEKEDWEIAAEAIDDWMRRHKPDALAMQVAKGYQWKSQFLPNGTLLRTVFGGKNYHCQVEADQILYNGKAVSPSGFVNAVGGIRRNAWRSTWILFPDSKDWKLADTLRNRARPRRARKAADDVQQVPALQPSAGRAPDTAAPVADPSPAVSPPGILCGTGRRISGEDRTAALLRQELLPLLYRLCAFDGLAPSQPNGPPSSQNAGYRSAPASCRTGLSDQPP